MSHARRASLAEVVDVAVAVLIRAQDGRVLLARRPRGKVYAGYWEFPGGKVESGESAVAALAREIREELGVDVGEAHPWITRVFEYPHARVRLHFFRVRSWLGSVIAREHDALAWQDVASVDVEPMLPANAPVLRALGLPAEYAITQAGPLGEELFIERLRQRLADGLALVQVREPAYAPQRMESFARRVVAIACPEGARVLVNGDAALAARVGAQGVHLTARQVAAMERRPDLPLVGASCHDAQELRAAERLGVDFAVLGPVHPTPTHPERAAMGWPAFERLARDAAIPVYALGGVAPGERHQAWVCGAHGIAMIRGSWRPA
ncbi:MAG: Nudix family hydrolase [Burkholderiales bacterium]|nr:Nudix family hydrolase [Burkholderiales bacterium]